MMRCDNCKERDAVINLTQVEHDTKCPPVRAVRAGKGIETGTAVLKSPLGTFFRDGEGRRCPFRPTHCAAPVVVPRCAIFATAAALTRPCYQSFKTICATCPPAHG
jgi:hypothetical protein